MLDRFNVTVLLRDHSRSMVNYRTKRPDRVAKWLLFTLPLTAGVAVVWTRYRLASPTALVPATSLLAGIFFAAVGQLISIRARIADSVQLAGNKRLRAHFRESVSGMLLAALAALFVSLLLGALSLLPPTVTGKAADRSDVVIEWLAIGCSAAVATAITYMILLFISSARRLYTSYLEAFEGGLPLPRPSRRAASRVTEEMGPPVEKRPTDQTDERPVAPAKAKPSD